MLLARAGLEVVHVNSALVWYY